MGVGRDLGLAEAAHLGADRLHVLVEAALADGGARALADQPHQGGAVLGGVALRDQGLDGVRAVACDLLGLEAERRGRAHHLALAHRDAGEELFQVFAQPDAHQQRLGLAEAPLLGEARRIGAELADRLGIGREPGEPMGGVLLGLQALGREPAVGADEAGAHAPRGVRGERLRGEAGFLRQGDEIGRGGGGLGGHRAGLR